MDKIVQNWKMNKIEKNGQNWKIGQNCILYILAILGILCETKTTRTTTCRSASSLSSRLKIDVNKARFAR